MRRELRLNPDGRAVFGDGLIEFALCPEGIAKLTVGGSISRADRHGCREVSYRLFGLGVQLIQRPDAHSARQRTSVSGHEVAGRARDRATQDLLRPLPVVLGAVFELASEHDQAREWLSVEGRRVLGQPAKFRNASRVLVPGLGAQGITPRVGVGRAGDCHQPCQSSGGRFVRRRT